MAVRNFWIMTANDISGAPQATGPRGKSEGFSTKVEQRNNGNSVIALRVDGFAHDDGSLELRVTDHSGNVVHTFTTER